MVKNPPSNAEDARLIPGRGTKIPCATGQLSPQAATTKPVCSRAHMPQLESLHASATEPMSSGARVPQLEKPTHRNEKTVHATKKVPRATTKTQCSKINFKKIFN